MINGRQHQVRTSDQFYLLAAQTFQDMNDWVNCLRLVAFGQQMGSSGAQSQLNQPSKRPLAQQATSNRQTNSAIQTDVLLEQTKPRAAPTSAVATAIGGGTQQANAQQPPVLTASQAAAAAASALAKTRQRQPSLLGSCKPQPPNDSPFIQTPIAAPANSSILNAVGQLNTMTPTVRGQLISTASAAAKPAIGIPTTTTRTNLLPSKSLPQLKPSTLDEEEENMLYCSIEDNPSEHNYRVKVIETELSLRCQLKCYQLTAPTTVSQQYEQLGRFDTKLGQYELAEPSRQQQQQVVTFYQLIIGPQELTLLNDYASSAMVFKQQQQQGLWSWPYQCIRRYGFDKDNCFMFEAGRKCTSGPGQFIVQTPKAYNIYQDVVKFVNELRSVGTSVNVLPKSNDPQQPNQSSQIITQIPVTWTPTNSALSVPATNNNGQDTRQQFFDALRQLDSSSQQQPIVTSQKTSICQEVMQRDPVASQTQDRNNQQIAGANTNEVTKPASSSPEETDESGYEQGDESVDSSTVHNRLKLTAMQSAQIRKQRLQVADSSASMSSSSSTASSTSGSLGYSANKKLAGLVGNETDSANNSSGSQQKAISRSDLINRTMLGLKQNDTLGGQVEDFEANLIRDVYSEITKLHAKFAVTTGANSAEDSISNHSAASTTNESSGDLSSNNSSADREDDFEQAAAEPMYSNLAARGKNSANRFHSNGDRGTGEDEGRNMRAKLQQHYPPNNPFHHQQPQAYDFGRPAMFPTVLNPIPECGELATPTRTTKQPPKVGPKPANFPTKSTNQQGKQANGKPTNHYIINDVQYAKISRNNFRPNYESFL